MVIRPIINVRSDKLSHGFTEAVKLCRELSSDKTGVILDLAEVHFVSPSFLLPVIVYMHQLGFPINMINIGTYLSTVSFSDGGIDAASIRQIFGIQILYGVVFIQKLYSNNKIPYRS